MESRKFIAEAQVLLAEVQAFSAAKLTPEEEQFQGKDLQKRLHQIFNGLHNPTLPSAYKLRDAATQAGFTLDSRLLHALHAHEFLQPGRALPYTRQQ